MKLRRHALENKVPAVRFDARHTGIDQKEAMLLEDSSFRGLSPTVEVAEGARVILIHTLCVEHNLLNGTQGLSSLLSTIQFKVLHTRMNLCGCLVLSSLTFHNMLDLPTMTPTSSQIVQRGYPSSREKCLKRMMQASHAFNSPLFSVGLSRHGKLKA